MPNRKIWKLNTYKAKAVENCHNAKTRLVGHTLKLKIWRVQLPAGSTMQHNDCDKRTLDVMYKWPKRSLSYSLTHSHSRTTKQSVHGMPTATAQM